MNTSMGIAQPTGVPSAPRPTPRPRREHGHSLGKDPPLAPCEHGHCPLWQRQKSTRAWALPDRRPREHGHCPTDPSIARVGRISTIRGSEHRESGQNLNDPRVEIGRT